MLIADNKVVFMLFYAIAWGIVANVQGRWKAFHWPLVHKVKHARRRVILSLISLNLLPFFFFAYVLLFLGQYNRGVPGVPLHAVIELVVQAMLPSLGVFGFYRIWLGTIERFPQYFYETDPSRLKKAFRHLEPTVSFSSRQKSGGTPVVQIGSDTAWPNMFWGAVYLVVSGAAPWFHL